MGNGYRDVFMNIAAQREYFTNIRFQNYISGRCLGYQGCDLYTTWIMLGYAIESQLKAGLAELEYTGVVFTTNQRKIIRSSHDLVELFNLCREKNLFLDVNVSYDFLKSSTLFLAMRYPSQQESSFRNIFNDHPCGFITTIHRICPYDDFILQLENSLYELYQDKKYSLFYQAFRNFRSSMGKNFFHSNAFAFVKYPKYLHFLNNSDIDERGVIEIITADPEKLWRNDAHGIFTPFNYRMNCLEKCCCEKFKLSDPEITYNEDGSIKSFKLTT